MVQTYENFLELSWSEPGFEEQFKSYQNGLLCDTNVKEMVTGFMDKWKQENKETPLTTPQKEQIIENLDNIKKEMGEMPLTE